MSDIAVDVTALERHRRASAMATVRLSHRQNVLEGLCETESNSEFVRLDMIYETDRRIKGWGSIDVNLRPFRSFINNESLRII
jgi:hypothetical protein